MMNTKTPLSLEAFNQLADDAAISQLLTCCTSRQWATQLISQRPFSSLDALIIASDLIWQHTKEADWLEAFDGHPQIGDVSTLKEKYRNTVASASHEQSGVNHASDLVLQQLAEGNQAYLDKFGFIFIVFASGKSAQEMLDLLLARKDNTRDEELDNAAAEQNKITQLRLRALFA